MFNKTHNSIINAWFLEVSGFFHIYIYVYIYIYSQETNISRQNVFLLVYPRVFSPKYIHLGKKISHVLENIFNSGQNEV